LNRTDYILKFKKEKKRFPTATELATAFKISERTALHELSSFRTTKPKPEPKKNKTVSFLRFFLILLSAMAFILSVYFTGSWFIGRFNIFIAGLISLSMVLFMVISPQVSRFISSPIVKFILWISFTIALLFSMGSTIAGQYNRTTEARESNRDTLSVYTEYETNEDEILFQIEETRVEKAIHQQTLEILSQTKEDRIENWQSIATERKYIDKFNEKIDRLTTELKAVRNNKMVELNNGIIEEKRDFYSFISKLTGKEISVIEFIISALPAVFIDLIAALCLNLALFIKEK